jgi:hypothetical protein
MTIIPSVSLDVRAQTFSAIHTDPSPVTTTGILAAPTGGYVYQQGSLLAIYTAGPDVGKYVNYLSTGTNGQQTFIGVLDDDLAFAEFVSGVPVIAPGTAVTIDIKLVRGAYYEDKLSALAGQVAAAITARGAYIVPDDMSATPRNLVYGLS